jgi:hypothetical protein
MKVGIIKAGLSGVVAIIIFSFIIAPFMCFSIAEDNPDVQCEFRSIPSIVLRIYTNHFSILLLALGFVLGVAIAKFYNLLENRNTELKKKIDEYGGKKKKFLWMWERS